MLAGTGAHKSGDQPTSLDLLHMGIRLLTATLLHSHGAFSGWAGETSSSILQFQYNSVIRVQGAASLQQGFWTGKGAFHRAVPGCLLLRAWRSNKASTQAFQFGKNVQRLYVRAVSSVHLECRSGLGYGTALNRALWVGGSCVANVADNGSLSAPVCNSAALQRVCLETVLLRPMRSKRQVEDGVPKPYTMCGKL